MIMDSLEKDLGHELSVRNKKVRRYKNVAKNKVSTSMRLVIENLLTHVDGIRKYTTPRQRYFLDEYEASFKKYGMLTERQLSVLKDIIAECEKRKTWNHAT